MWKKNFFKLWFIVGMGKYLNVNDNNIIIVLFENKCRIEGFMFWCREIDLVLGFWFRFIVCEMLRLYVKVVVFFNVFLV